MAKQRIGGVVKFVGNNGQPPQGAGNGNGWQDAFRPGQNFGDPSSLPRRQSAITMSDRMAWDSYVNGLNVVVTASERTNVQKRDDPLHPGDPTKAFGYIGTYNSRKINAALYDPQNAGKSVDQIKFKRPQDRETVKSMDSIIARNRTGNDGLFTRYQQAAPGMTLAQTLQQIYPGLSNTLANDLANAARLPKRQLNALSRAMKGVSSFNAAYSSTSANRTMNVFQNMPIMRSIRVPGGTNAYTTRNAAESETIFGRGMITRIVGISTNSVNGHEHVVIEEELVGFKP